jgi:hypothetical protein
MTRSRAAGGENTRNWYHANAGIRLRWSEWELAEGVAVSASPKAQARVFIFGITDDRVDAIRKLIRQRRHKPADEIRAKGSGNH